MNCRACGLHVTGDGSDDHGCWRCKECGYFRCDDKPCECADLELDELCAEEGSEFIEYEIDIPALDAAGAEPTNSGSDSGAVTSEPPRSNEILMEGRAGAGVPRQDSASRTDRTSRGYPQENTRTDLAGTSSRDTS